MDSDFTIRNEVDSVKAPHADEPYYGSDSNGYSQINFRSIPAQNPFLSPIDARTFSERSDPYYSLLREYQNNNFKLAMAIIATIKWVAISAAVVTCIWFLKKPD